MSKTKKWLREVDRVEEAVDEAMARILRRDGRKAYEDASGDFLTGFCNTMVHMDGGNHRLLGRLRRLERMYGAPGISEKIVAALPIPETGNRLHYFSGAALQGKKAPSGFAVRVTAAGSKAFVWFHRVNGIGRLETIGRWSESPKGGDLTVRNAIIKCANRAAEVSMGGKEVDPLPARTRNA